MFIFIIDIIFLSIFFFFFRVGNLTQQKRGPGIQVIKQIISIEVITIRFS